MAEVGIRYFGSLREIVGKRSEKVKIEDSATLEDLLEKLSVIHGPVFRNLVYTSSGKIRESLAFAVDGDAIPSTKLTKTSCREAKEFVILPPISGGSNYPKS